MRQIISTGTIAAGLRDGTVVRCCKLIREVGDELLYRFQQPQVTSKSGQFSLDELVVAAENVIWRSGL